MEGRMDQWQQDLVALDQAVWQWSEHQRRADVRRTLLGQEGTLERAIAEVEDAMHQAAWAEACEEVERSLHYREASCLNCRQVWWNYDGYDGPCPHCDGQPLMDPDEPWDEN
jgi:hypothetical protein